MLKIIIDTNVLLQMLYSPKSVEKSASRKVYDLVVSDTINAYWCDIFSGETIRIASTDPKLSKVKKPYLDTRLTELMNHMENVKMDTVNKVRATVKWEPEKYNYKVNENDVYLVVMAILTKSKYIITNDNEFTEAYNNTFCEKNSIVCTPRKFLSLENPIY